jgi:hypothetical protein
MQLFCQSCQVAYAGISNCPKCGERLLAPQESFIFSGTPKDAQQEQVPATITARMGVGVAAGLGLYVGLRELASAIGVLGFNGPTDGAVDFALRLFALLAGAILAGAGRKQGLPAGLGVGAVGGGLLLAADTYLAGGLAAAGWVAPAAAGVIAVLSGPAGAVGALVWPPEVELPKLDPAVTASSRGSSLLRLAEETNERIQPRPTLWLRILAGAAVAAAGLMLSDDIRMWLNRGSAGLLQTGGLQRGPIVGFQIAVFLLALGGVVSAAGTGAGFRHGFLTGVLTAAVVYFVTLKRTESFPAVDGYFITFGREVESIAAGKRAAAEVTGLVIGLSTLGGWLGGQLFPPLVPPELRKRRLVRQS